MSILTFTKCILKYINISQKPARVKTSRSICAQLEKDANFKSRIVFINESWVYFCIPETKQQPVDLVLYEGILL